MRNKYINILFRVVINNRLSFLESRLKLQNAGKLMVMKQCQGEISGSHGDEYKDDFWNYTI
jgi:hypothetical protein